MTPPHTVDESGHDAVDGQHSTRRGRLEARRQLRRDSRHPLRRRAGIAGLVAAALATGGAGFAYVSLNGNINRVDVSHILGVRPSQSTGDERALNILVMGSDTREGLGTTEFGKDTIEGGAHSDTNLLVHLSADRQAASVVSIPRDSMTMAPRDCTDPASTVEDGIVRQWNYNFNKGGPGCTVKTLEGLTGIYVDHFVVVDFRGFQTMVDALGGVEVCTPVAIDDKDSGLQLDAGRHRLQGKQALGYVRVRKTVTGGSDLNRIKRQQAFMSSIVQEATKTSLLLRPDRLYNFLEAATGSMTTDQDLGFGTMTDVASSLKGLGVGNVQFVTVPNEVYPQDPNRVQWAAAADELWESIRLDKPLPGAETTKEAEDETLTVSPADIVVRVVNVAGVPGLARQESAALAVQGFQASAGDGEAGTSTGVVVRHSTSAAEAARTVAAAFPKATMVVDETLDDVVEVRLGVGAGHVREVSNRVGTEPLPAPTVESGTSAPGASIETRKADADICA